MKIVIAPDSFKECLSSREVAATLGRAIRRIRLDSIIRELPLADGGEGTVAVLTPALGGEIVQARVSDPLGRPVMAQYGIIGETAIVEVAAACGLGLLTPEERNPLKTTTYGVGQLLLDARNRGCRQFIVGLGGSATCDGGAGMMSVPGIREALQGDGGFALGPGGGPGIAAGGRVRSCSGGFAKGPAAPSGARSFNGKTESRASCRETPD